MSISHHKKQRSAGLFLILGIVSVASLGVYIWWKYNGIKENNPQKIAISDNLKDTIGNIVNLLLRY
jgi:hypothetical protein